MRRKILILLALLMLLPSGVLADVAVNGTGGAALIASDGAQIIPAGVYSRIFPLKEGFWGAVEPYGKCVLLNGAGEPVSDARFDELRCVRRTLLYREGGAWGIALLAEYMMNKAEGETLEAYLDNKVFADMKCVTLEPDQKDVEGFNKFMERYIACLPVERAAVETLK